MDRRTFFGSLLSGGAALAVPPVPKREGHQKFLRGDLVRLSTEFPKNMAHFGGRGKMAVVVGPYTDQYGYCTHTEDCRHCSTYTLLFEDEGRVSWYGEGLLTMVSPRNMERLDLLDKAAHE